MFSKNNQVGSSSNIIHTIMVKRTMITSKTKFYQCSLKTIKYVVLLEYFTR